VAIISIVTARTSKGRGFKLFLDKGAYFPTATTTMRTQDCSRPRHHWDGAYTDGHGIASNEWWDLSRTKERPISSVEDETTGS